MVRLDEQTLLHAVARIAISMKSNDATAMEYVPGPLQVRLSSKANAEGSQQQTLPEKVGSITSRTATADTTLEMASGSAIGTDTKNGGSV